VTNRTTSGDIMGLQAAYANLNTDQERDYFMQRYHDVISSFGGKTSYDADNRPLLVMRSNLWASGYDVDGTDQTSLGQFSGRVQQTYKYFFQAEDVIRDWSVTGVQTCALPICPLLLPARRQPRRRARSRRRRRLSPGGSPAAGSPTRRRPAAPARGEPDRSGAGRERGWAAGAAAPPARSRGPSGSFPPAP